LVCDNIFFISSKLLLVSNEGNREGYMEKNCFQNNSNNQNYKDKKTVSIAMTTYNGEKYIEKQLRSIFAQTLQPGEIVICDDCSKDRTMEIIRAVVKEYGAENRVRLVENQENLGYIRNFHQAIGMTSGDFLFLADQDDEWYPHKLERVMEVMEETGAEVICTGFDFIDENGNLIDDSECFKIDPLIRKAKPGLTSITFYQLALNNYVPGCTYCCTRKTAQAFFDMESQILPHDYQIMIVGSLLGKVYYLNEKTIGYRIHENNTLGFKGTVIGFRLKKPKRKPQMVCVLDDISRVLKIPHRWYYNLLFYLRIPYLTMIIKSKLEKFCR